MTPPRAFNLKRNVWFAVVEFTANIALVLVGYRLVIQQGGLEALGLWATLFAWTSLLRVGDAGMANATMRFVSLRSRETDGDGIRTYAQTGVIATFLIFGALALVGYLGSAPFVGTLVGPQHAEAASAVLPLMFLVFALLNLSGVLSAVLQGLHLGYLRSQLSILGNLIQLGLVTVLVPSIGLLGLAWAQFFQHLFVALTSWLIVRRATGIATPLPLKFEVAAFRDMLGFGLATHVATVSNSLFEPISKLLVSHFGGLYAQGLYELAYKTLWLPRNAVIAGTSATTPSMTRLYIHDRAQAGQLYTRTAKATTASVFVLVLLLLLASPIISLAFLDRWVTEYSFFVLILAFGVALNAMGAGAYNLAMVTGYMRHNLVVNGTVLALLIAAGVAAGTLLPVFSVLIVVSSAMALGGLLIRRLNERLLVLTPHGTGTIGYD